MNYWRGLVKKQPNTKNVEITSLAPHFSSYIASRRLYLKSGSKLSFMLVLLLVLFTVAGTLARISS